MPTILLWGVAPVPPTGPVPPITPPPSGVCKHAGGQPLPPGLYCAGALPSWANVSVNAVVECPSALVTQCPGGGVCTPTGNGTASCAPDPAAFCSGRVRGLFCDPAWQKPTPDWPDRFVECPGTEPELCPTQAPHCVQAGLTIRCDA